MNEEMDKFRKAVHLGQYTEALAIFHDFGDESYVRLLLGEIEYLLRVIEDSSKKESHKRFKVILDSDNLSSSPIKPSEGSTFYNVDDDRLYQYNNERWSEI